MKDWRYIVKQIHVEAAPQKVWQALTEESALRVWLAEHAILEPTVGGRFALWGHGTYGAEIPLTAPGHVVAIEPNQKLSLKFTLMGFQAHLTIALHPEDSGTLVRASYELPNNSESMPWYLTSDHAIMLLFNLRSYAETGQTCLLPDPATADGVVQMAITISASPSDAFRAITVPEVMDKWLSSTAKVDLRPGGDYLFGWTETTPDGTEIPAGPIEIIDFEPDQALRHTWRYTTESPTQVEWLIQAGENTTTVRLTHSGFGPTDDTPAYTQGWAAFLCALKALLENKAQVVDTQTA